MPSQLITIKNKIALLNKKRKSYKLPSIKFYPPLAEKTIIAFEKKHSIIIPEDYRQFLLHIGNGQRGNSPFYAYFHLNTLKNALHYVVTLKKILPNFLSTPFPFTNTITKKIIYSIEKENNYCPLFAHLYDSCPEREIPGYLCLSDTGECDVFYGLIVTGEQREKMWKAGEGNYPLYKKEKNKIIQHTFFSWYEEWLDKHLENSTLQEIHSRYKEWGKLLK